MSTSPRSAGSSPARSDPAAAGREVRYLLRGEALAPARDWIAAAEAAWDLRLKRLKRQVMADRPPSLSGGFASSGLAS